MAVRRGPFAAGQQRRQGSTAFMAEISRGRSGGRRGGCATEPAIGPWPPAIRQQLRERHVTFGAEVLAIFDIWFLIFGLGRGRFTSGGMKDGRLVLDGG